MGIFSLPNTAKVNRVIPKNAFDFYSSSKQKKQFTDHIAKITWIYKLSPDTVNLEAKDIKEIQVFQVELKVKEDIQAILDIIDKAIPYNIIFIVEYEGHFYLSTSIKHPHPLNENKAVIDWTFKTEWLIPSENKFTLELKRSLDAVYQNFCIQLTGKNMTNKSLGELVHYVRRIDKLKKEIEKLKMSIKNSKQFNQKVDLNIKLKAAEEKLQLIMGDNVQA